MQNGTMQENNLNALQKYAIDLTQKAKDGKIDPIIGREEEIRRAMQILSRRTKNNPILIGEPGVGKTAIVEGLAQRIVNQDVPDSLLNKKIFSLDLGSVMAGAKYRGELEDRLKALIGEVVSSNGEIILFIDEVHILMGVGGDQGSISAANLLKPALARGELHCIGATTLKEYREHIEKDAALTRRFQYVIVNEPSQEEAIAMLRGIRDKIELHHGVKIQDNALVQAVKLSIRYIHDRYLPDKAIDLIEEAASKLKLELTSRPEKVDSLERQLIILKMEKEALSKEENAKNNQKLKDVEEKIKHLEEELANLKARWENEKALIAQINECKKELDTLNMKLANFTKIGDLEQASKYKYDLIPATKKRLQELEQKAEKMGDPILRNVVTEDQVYTAVAKITGIPLQKITQTEKEKLLQLEAILNSKIIGQEKAVEAVSNAIRRSKAGIAPAHKPVGVFLFLGPTGVGKTELARALADTMFGTPKAMMRLDMSEYMEKHAISKLIGAPPGYIGYEEGGVLTESVRRNPWQIILFDEIEKAHPEVFNLMLQIFDAGRLSDRSGRVIDFSNTIIILTSNLGAELLKPDATVIDEETEKKMIENLTTCFSLEFINRLDDILIFNRLSYDSMKKIVILQLEELQNVLAERQIKVTFKQPEISEYLVNKGFSPVFGARPLKRLIQKEIYNILATTIISGELDENSVVEFYIDNGAPKAKIIKK